ncbi:peroxiredoxin [Namhaeicola litoreus]|uniref:thioredoxin-dependent peroxiredoxin n=1 Tax=Namhaeicola litoreus TaxID=1052145 RepID=A0ABW3Y5R1_9FLAO
MKIKSILLVVLFGLISTLISCQMKSNQPLKVGDQLPHFTLMDQTGSNYDIQKDLGKKNLVIYFYPKDDTPGCTKEACKFRDDYHIFNDLNAKVIGISSDNVKSHADFAAKYNLPFTLLSDGNNELRKSFGVPSNMFGLVPGRVTYIVGMDGKVKYIFNNLFKAEQHIEEAKKILQRT